MNFAGFGCVVQYDAGSNRFLVQAQQGVAAVSSPVYGTVRIVFSPSVQFSAELVPAVTLYQLPGSAPLVPPLVMAPVRLESGELPDGSAYVDVTTFTDSGVGPQPYPMTFSLFALRAAAALVVFNGPPIPIPPPPVPPPH